MGYLGSGVIAVGMDVSYYRWQRFLDWTLVMHWQTDPPTFYFLKFDILNNLIFMYKITSQTASTIFQNKLRIYPHPTTVYYHLILVSQNTNRQSESHITEECSNKF